MGTITGRQIVDKAVKLLLDGGHVRWTLDELLGWLNSGFTAIVEAKPTAYTRNRSIQLVMGTKQTLPVDAISLVEISRNMGVNGATPGTAITFIKKKILDQSYPGWHGAIGTALARFFCSDARDLKTFYVMPPSTGNNHVEAVYFAVPAPLVGADAETALNGVIPFDNSYENTLIDYLLYRAFSKEGDAAGADAKAGSYYTLFTNALGIKEKGELIGSPEANNLQGE